MKLLWFFKSYFGLAPDANAYPKSMRYLRSAVWVSFFGLLILLLWAAIAELDEITRAPGAVVVSSKNQVIQTQDGGMISEIFVREGDSVKLGQPLMELDSTRPQAAYREAHSRLAALAAAIDRLNAELLDRPLQFSKTAKAFPEITRNQAGLYNKRRSALSDEIASIELVLRLAEQELEMIAPLLSTGDVSRTDVLRAERQVADLKAQILNRRNRYFQEVQAELSRTQEEYYALEQTLAQRASQLEQTILRSPMAGVVKNIRLTTKGGVLRPGDEAMQIVPAEDTLLIEAKVAAADIGFLKLGLPATVKIDAYDSTIYGGLPGELIYISADTLREDLRQGEAPYYQIQVRTSGRQFSGRPDAVLDIQPGMTASVEIKTGSRTVLRYLTKPIVKTLDESMGER